MPCQILNPYETSSYLTEYLLLHYGAPADICPFDFLPTQYFQFHHRVFNECVLPVHPSGETKALDLGCAVGRFSFELTRMVDHVIGVDLSRAFIDSALQMLQNRKLDVEVTECGQNARRVTVNLPADLPQGKVDFIQGDAMELGSFPAHSFHIVAAINLLCRLPAPRDFLAQLARLVVPGGQLIIASPFSWQEEYSPPGQWFDSLEMEELLKRDFRRVSRQDLPFVIREHRRKYQFVISEVSVFIRRD